MCIVAFKLRGCSSDGRALALHVRGTGIDARHLQLLFILFHFFSISLIFLISFRLNIYLLPSFMKFKKYVYMVLSIKTMENSIQFLLFAK